MTRKSVGYFEGTDSRLLTALVLADFKVHQRAILVALIVIIHRHLDDVWIILERYVVHIGGQIAGQGSSPLPLPSSHNGNFVSASEKKSTSTSLSTSGRRSAISRPMRVDWAAERLLPPTIISFKISS